MDLECEDEDTNIIEIVEGAMDHEPTKIKEIEGKPTPGV